LYISPLNTDVDEINSKILSMVLGCSRTYLSSYTFRPAKINSIIDDINPPEMLHGMNFSGFPNHKIQLKVGVPLSLLFHKEILTHQLGYTMALA